MLVRRKRHETPGLNTTSTADISFMLLIFFLVTTSMDVDKGLSRQLPSPEPQKKEQQESLVDKTTLMAIHLKSGDSLLVNDKPMKVSQLKDEVVRFVHRLGAKHVVSVESDREANYDLYFQMQNQLMEAYNQLRNEQARKAFGKDYAALSNAQKEKVRKACPQRITESYANAMAHQDKSIDANAEEKQGEDKNVSSSAVGKQREGGKQ